MRITYGKTRCSNIELFRVVVMLLIIMHHCLVNSDLFATAYDYLDSTKSWLVFFVGSFGKMGINCFVLITGYYMCKQKISLKKYLVILCEILFYSIMCMIVLALFGVTEINLESIVHYTLLTTGESIQFPANFLLFYPLIPFLNILIRNLDFVKHTLLNLFLIFIFSVRANIPDFTVSLNYVYWFCVVYLIGAYLRLYSDRLGSFVRSLKWLFTILVVLFGLSFLTIKQGILMTEVSHDDYILFYMMDSNKLLPLFLAVFMFLLFKAVSIPNNRVINLLGKATFGVLLFHNGLGAIIWPWIAPEKWYFSDYLFLFIFVCAIVIFTVSAFVDFARRFLIERPLLSVLGNHIDGFEKKMIRGIYRRLNGGKTKKS